LSERKYISDYVTAIREKQYISNCKIFNINNLEKDGRIYTNFIINCVIDRELITNEN